MDTVMIPKISKLTCLPRLLQLSPRLYLTDKAAESEGGAFASCPLEYVRKNNNLFTMVEVEQLTPHGIGAVTPDLWKKYVEHVQCVEDKYWEQDGLIEEVVEECLEQFGEEDSDDNDSDIDSDMDSGE